MSLIEDLAAVADELAVERLPQVMQHLPAEWIEEALAASGVATIRRRRLPADRVVWLVIGMALLRGLPIQEVVAKLDLALPSTTGRKAASSATTQARQRVGEEPLKALFEMAARKWSDEAWGESWRGLQVFALDGSMMSVADTEQNAAYFGRHHSGKNGSSACFPQLRIAWLMGTRTRMVRAAVFGPMTIGEMTYAKELIDEVPPETLLIADRLYVASPFILPLIAAGGRQFLVRAKSNTRWTVVRSLGQDDDLVEITVSDEAHAADPTLPRSYRARAITSRKGRTPYVLLTSLIDAERYPADEIRGLYSERWEVELAYAEIKSRLLQGEDVLRSKSVEGVRQELWGALIAYNLVRLEMARIAEENRVPPRRISFTIALRFICDEWLSALLTLSPGNIPKRLERMRLDLRDAILPPRRTARSYPRVVKRKDSAYPRKKSPSQKANRA